MKSFNKKRFSSNEAAGAIIAFHKQPQGVSGSTDNGVYFEITIYSDACIRLQYRRQEPPAAAFSYAVAGQPQQHTIWQLRETATHYIISTALLQLHLQKEALRCTFYNAVGTLLNADDPAFGVSWIGNEATVYKTLQPEERFIGLGEKTGNLDRRGSAYTHWNTDYFAYPEHADPLYVSIPFYIGVHQGTQYGIFVDKSQRSVFNFGASNHRFAYFAVQDDEVDYYFLHDNDVAGILRAYSQLTGTLPLPPLWALGFQQCRYSYYPDTEVLTLAQTFRDKQIPADVLYCDIHYMDAYKVFTWHQQYFPQPKKMIAALRKQGFHLTLILDPGIKTEEGYEPYESGLQEDVFIKYPDQSNYSASVWPGVCYFPDFTKPDTRRWWGKRVGNLVQQGLDSFWNDMNEPASWGQCTPDLLEFDYEGEGATHKQARNIYGMQMARATYEGAVQHLKGKRPFVLTRAGFAGIQRYAAVWTGDNVSNDGHLLLGVRLLNSLGLSGVGFCGVDIGGFCGDASPVLFSRWISIGAFSPFFRCHSMINSRDSEPWSFGEEAEEIARNYIALRYRLLPYLYSLFYEATQSGLPPMRSLAITHTHDERIYQGDFQHQFMFGNSLLICPCDSHQRFTKVYLPQGSDWYSLHSDDYYTGGQEMIVEAPAERLPIFVKAGGMLLLQSVVQYTAQKPEDTLEIHVYDSEQNSDDEMLYYEDDGETYQYQKNDECLIWKIKWNTASKTLSVQEKFVGNYTSKFTKARVYVHSRQQNITEVIHINRKKYTLLSGDYCFVPPVSNFDPFIHNNSNGNKIAVRYAEFSLKE
ncbi:MAG: DUF4968 domain-containing protein [Sphingobacteriales bacterium]|nr:DUF4968 domain-containing protein [Sphingobacteriales bacterium]